MGKKAEVPAGVEVRHQKHCGKSKDVIECANKCSPNVRGLVWDPNTRKSIRKSFNGRRSATDRVNEAAGWVRDSKKAIKDGRMKAHERRTLDSVIVEFLDLIDAGVVLSNRKKRYSPTTRSRYRDALTRRLPEEYRNKDANSLTTLALRNYVQDLLKAGAAPSTVRNTIYPLSAMYRWALKLEHVDFNPTLDIELPANHAVKPRSAIQLVEVPARLDALDDLWDKALWGLGYYCGHRRSEALGQTIENLDFKKKRVTIGPVWHLMDGIDEDAGKSDAATRTVPMPAPLEKILRAYIVATGRRSGNLLGAAPDEPFSGCWRTVLRRAERQWDKHEPSMHYMNYHEARHTFCTWLIEAHVAAGQIDYKRLIKITGHSSVAILTDTYNHLFPNHLEHAADAQDAYLAAVGL